MDNENIDLNIYDEEIVYPNCTVQLLRNSQTGEELVGWWINEEGVKNESLVACINHPGECCRWCCCDGVYDGSR